MEKQYEQKKTVCTKYLHVRTQEASSRVQEASSMDTLTFYKCSKLAHVLTHRCVKTVKTFIFLTHRCVKNVKKFQHF